MRGKGEEHAWFGVDGGPVGRWMGRSELGGEHYSTLVDELCDAYMARESNSWVYCILGNSLE
jgi:hypothetical protein